MVAGSHPPELVRRRSLGLVLVFAWLLAALLVWMLFSAEHDEAVEALLDRNLQTLSISWQAVQALQRNSVTTYFEEYVEDPRTIELLQAAQDPAQIELARLRLFRHLAPAYERMIKRGVRQFQFHRPNGDSFLRFHHPARFGDNLLGVRESIRRVNNELEPIFGFEVGRVVSGYRSVFPILDDQGRHLGSVELSMPFNVLQEELQALVPSHSIQLLLHAQRQRDILFDEQQSLYEPWPASADFLIEDPHGLRPDSPPRLAAPIEQLIERLGQRPDLVEHMVRGQEQAFRLKSDGRDYAVLLVPVVDPGGMEVGLVASYVAEPELALLDRGLILRVVGAWLTLLALAIGVFVLIRQLDAKLSERNRLKVITNTIGQGLYLTDTDGRIINANPHAQALLGYSEAQMQGQQAHDLFHRHEANAFEPATSCSIIGSVQAGAEYRDEAVFRAADGSLFEVMVVSSPLLQRGRFAGAVTVFEDIRERKAAERVLQERDRRLRKLGAELPGFVYQYLARPDGSSAFIYASDGIRDIYGMGPEQVKDDAAPVFAVLHADEIDAISAGIADSARDLTPWHAIYRVHHPDHGLIWVEGHATPERMDDGGTMWHGYIHDVTEREQAQRQLEESEAKYRTLVENAPVIIYRSEVASPWRMLHISRSVERLSGYPWQEFIAGTVHWGDLLHPDDVAGCEQATAEAVAGNKPFEIEYRILRADGAIRWMHETGGLHKFEESHGGMCLQGIITDITEQKSDQLQLQRSAHYDALTGLPNRVLLADRLEQAMVRTLRTDKVVALVFVDLDNFKPINDQYGHAVGDQVLVGIAERMRSSLRNVDTLARLGGDEFVAVLSDLSGEADAQPLVQRLLDALSAPLEVHGRKLQVTGSAGLTFYPQQMELDADQLLRQADQAMYQSKVKGRNTWHVFDLVSDASVRGRHAALDRFKAALDNDELVLHYQPQVNLRSGQVIGVEALVRWQHPERGLLMPGDFLPVIERTDMDYALGQWVLAQALEQCQRWSDDGIDLTMAVNLSAHCLQQPDFLDCVDRLLADWPNLPVDCLEFEILESSALSNLGGISALVGACAERGIRFALDDFGTGYSSLSYLKRLPVSVLKVDRSFISDVDHDVDDLSILEGVLGLGRAFQLEIVAEGVETIEQGSLLLQLGCERAQGYVIARPMPGNKIPDWISQWRPEPAWQAIQSLPLGDFPLLYGMVAAQMASHFLDQYLCTPGRSPNLPVSLISHIQRTLDARSRWPERQPYLDGLEDVYRNLQRLANRLAQATDRHGESEAQDAVSELTAINLTLAACRASLS